MQLGFIDHYDSFSFNVIDWLREDSIEILYAPYDDPIAMARVQEALCPVVLSPGPGRPEDKMPTLDLVRDLLGLVPIFGICLGHQILAHLAGARIIRSQAPFHGTVRPITVHHPDGILRNTKPTFGAAVYHSLVADMTHADPMWKTLAYDDLGEVQALGWAPRDGRASAWGVQFHPESFMSEERDKIRSAWLHLAQSGRSPAQGRTALWQLSSRPDTKAPGPFGHTVLSGLG